MHSSTISIIGRMAIRSSIDMLIITNVPICRRLIIIIANAADVIAQRVPVGESFDDDDGHGGRVDADAFGLRGRVVVCWGVVDSAVGIDE